jgi:hypothetical protein
MIVFLIHCGLRTGLDLKQRTMKSQSVGEHARAQPNFTIVELFEIATMWCVYHASHVFDSWDQDSY